MEKKLSKHGNSFVVLIDKPILDLLNINEDTTLKIKTDGKNIIIEPVNAAKKHTPGIISKDKKLQKAYETIVDKYDATLKKLADN